MYYQFTDQMCECEQLWKLALVRFDCGEGSSAIGPTIETDDNK